jgi:HK97 gp10 family phage protein
VIEIRVESEDLKRFLANLEGGIPNLLRRVNRKVGQVIFTFSQMWCPVKTGFLKKSGYAREEGDDFVVGYTAPYGPYVEWGTSRMAPRSFLRTAWIMTKGNLSSIVRPVIQQYVEESKG